jgi:hypothetical protein
MSVGDLLKSTIKLMGAITKVSVEIGAETIGLIAEKIDDNSQSKDRIVNYGKSLGQSIIKGTDQISVISADVLDKVVNSGVNTFKNISEEIALKVSESANNYEEEQKDYIVVKNLGFSITDDNNENITLEGLNKKLEGITFYLKDEGPHFYKLVKDKYATDITFNVTIEIDRSINSTPPYGSKIWMSGTKIEINIKIYAKYDELVDCSSCDEYGDFYEIYMYKYNTPEILAFDGKRYSGNCDQIDLAELSEMQILSEISEYYNVIFEELECHNVFCDEKNSPLYINESTYDDDDYYESDDDKQNMDPDMWDREDINEYYGYDRDYDGDVD